MKLHIFNIFDSTLDNGWEGSIPKCGQKTPTFENRLWEVFYWTIKEQLECYYI
jgi:hypothetical protein